AAVVAARKLRILMPYSRPAGAGVTRLTKRGADELLELREGVLGLDAPDRAAAGAHHARGGDRAVGGGLDAPEHGPALDAGDAAARCPLRFCVAPASRSSRMRSWCRSRSSTPTGTSVGSTPLASATASTFSAGEALMSIASRAAGPHAILSMYTAAPGKNIVP